MAGHPHEMEPGIYDIIGIGFGPSNLALAVAVEEHNARADTDGLRCVFRERQERFGWHRGMLLDGATMQVFYLKDLVTLRNPTSDFTFLAYLHGRRRLVDFINHKTMFPLRREFHDYLEWAATRLSHLVEYGQTVVTLRPVIVDGDLRHVDVVSRPHDGPGRTVIRRARNVVIAAGLQPCIPDGITLDDRIWHNSDLLGRVARMPSTPHGRFIVVGAGQSAAEVTDYLHRGFPGAEVYSVFARYGYSPADNSAFANQIFDPDAVDDFFAAPDEVREMLTGYHRSTNYSVVDIGLIDDLYRRVYEEKVHGTPRLRMLRASRVVSMDPVTDGVRATVEFLPTGQRRAIDADVVVLATGYRAREPRDLLGELADHCDADGAGRLAVTRDYRVTLTGSASAAVYVPGASEHAHGISSTLLSNVAVRAGEILASVLDRTPGTAAGTAAASSEATTAGADPAAATARPTALAMTR